MNTVIIFVAKYFFVVPALIFIIYGLATKKRGSFWLLAIIALPLSYILAKIGGHFFYDPRPFVVSHTTPLIPHAADNGFPSDHALLVSALAAVVTIFSAPLGILMWIFAILIGAARVLAHVHHTIDILGAFFFSSISTLFVAWILKIGKRNRSLS